MDLKQQAIEAYQAHKAQEWQAKLEAARRRYEKDRAALEKVIAECFEAVEFYYEFNGVRAIATTGELAGFRFWVVFDDGPKLYAGYNGGDGRRVYGLHTLGELLSTTEPEPESEGKPSTSKVWFREVLSHEANDLRNAGRDFNVIGLCGENRDYLVIEFTDLWRIDDDDLPF